jgi:hypothetical protein
MMPAFDGLIARKSAAGAFLAKLGDCAGHFDAGRARSDDDEIEQAAMLFRVHFRLRLLEGEQNTPAQIGRIVDALQARRVFLPFVVAEIGVCCAGWDDELVEANALSFGDNLLAGQVDPRHLGEHDRGVRLPSENLPDRGGDVGWKERPAVAA